jgi:hypothetical protein
MSTADLLGAYGVVTLIVGVFALWLWTDSPSDQCKSFARVTLACWAWPLLLLAGVAWLIRNLWKDAR